MTTGPFDAGKGSTCFNLTGEKNAPPSETTGCAHAGKKETGEGRGGTVAGYRARGADEFTVQMKAAATRGGGESIAARDVSVDDA